MLKIIKRQAMGSKTILAKHMSDKGIGCEIHKEPYKSR